MAVFRSGEPDSTGAHWLEKPGQDDPILIRIIRHNRELSVASTKVAVKWIDGVWTGPLPTPEEMKAEAERDVAEEVHRFRYDMYVEKERE